MSAQPIRCDAPDHDHLADVMVNRMDGSLAIALCDAAFLGFAAAMLEAISGSQEAPSGPEGSGDGSKPAQRPRGRSRPRSVPAPAVAAEEVPEPDQGETPAPAQLTDYQPDADGGTWATPEPERESVEA